tara:strand:+ start:442 stop:909 length:468 start_codon:yes stop_codon:yes gene_type:complete
MPYCNEGCSKCCLTLSGINIDLLYQPDIMQDIREVIEIEKSTKSTYAVYYTDNDLIKKFNNNTVCQMFKERAKKHITSAMFKHCIRFYAEYALPFDIKNKIFHKAYAASKEKETNIEDELEIVYDNLSESELTDIAYYTLLTSYVINYNYLIVRY